MDWQLGIAIIVCGMTLVFVWRGADVRLVLLGAGIVLTASAGVPHRLLDAFLNTVGDENILGPICTAMGYAFVLRTLGADQALVEGLLYPLQRLRWLLVPGGCVVGFITNMAITSQTAAAAAAGPILVPLLQKAGYEPALAGAILVLGCSAGGNLYNPSTPDIVAIANSAGTNPYHAISAISIPHLAGFTVATVMLTAIARKHQSTYGMIREAITLTRSHLIRALLPPLPVILLIALLPQWRIVPVIAELYPAGVPITHVIVSCTILAVALHWRRASELTRRFFEGVGYGFANVISIIIAASCFLEGLRVVGMIERLVQFLQQSDNLAPVLSTISPMILAIISGSGTAPSVAFSRAVLPDLATMSSVSYAVELGALGAIGASMGRTMSPLAAVVVFSAQLVNCQPRQVVRFVALPVLIASIVTVTVYYIGRL